MIAMDRLEQRILCLRGERVMLDGDLSKLYGVPPKVLKQAVKRNMGRFPSDFMLELNREEMEALSRSHFVTLKQGRNIKYAPFAFTEQGVAMLSSVLRSERAIRVNIEIMRAFVKLRRVLSEHASLARKIEAMEKKYDRRFKVVFDAIRRLMDPPSGRIGVQRE
ncbi:MAG TPA: ORF6N domain-containing protein [Planctomycetota bacterium]|nr:ORF6N domain-containing protein [Planctomycetota bacterium]